jgi:hypothetical protein
VDFFLIAQPERFIAKGMPSLAPFDCLWSVAFSLT